MPHLGRGRNNTGLRSHAWFWLSVTNGTMGSGERCGWATTETFRCFTNGSSCWKGQSTESERPPPAVPTTTLRRSTAPCARQRQCIHKTRQRSCRRPQFGSAGCQSSVAGLGSGSEGERSSLQFREQRDKDGGGVVLFGDRGSLHNLGTRWPDIVIWAHFRFPGQEVGENFLNENVAAKLPPLRVDACP